MTTLRNVLATILPEHLDVGVTPDQAVNIRETLATVIQNIVDGSPSIGIFTLDYQPTWGPTKLPAHPGNPSPHDPVLSKKPQATSNGISAKNIDKSEGGVAYQGAVEKDIHTFETGAVRGTDANDTRFDLISPHILEALARTYAEGSRKYGDDNWLKGIPSKDLMNHALRHINLWQTGDTSENHLAHAMWNLGAIIHFSVTRPELIVRQYSLSKETADVKS